MMNPTQERTNPAEVAQRAHGVLADVAHVVALAMHQKTDLAEYQREFVCEALKRAVGQINRLLESAWLGEGLTPWEYDARFHAPIASREASGGVSPLGLPASATG